MSKPTLNVLIADDEPHIRELITWMMQQLGAVVFTAEHGGQAWEIFQRQKIDLCLLDVNMPVMNGLTLLQKIRTQKDDALVVMLTAINSCEVVEKCIELGAYNYILKNTPPEELHSILEEIWNSSLSELGY